MVKVDASQELLTAKKVEDILGISATTRWRWEKKGILKSHRIGGKRYYRFSEILALTEGKKAA